MKKIFFIAALLFNTLAASEDFETILKAGSNKRKIALQAHIMAHRETALDLAAFQGVRAGIVMPCIMSAVLKQEGNLFDCGAVLYGVSYIQSDIVFMKKVKTNLEDKIKILQDSLARDISQETCDKIEPSNQEWREKFVAGLMLASIISLPAKAILDRNNFSGIDLAAHIVCTVPIALVVLTHKLVQS